MVIKLDRVKKIALLQALQSGVIDTALFADWDTEKAKETTKDEIKTQCLQLIKLDSDFDTCRMCQDVNRCMYNFGLLGNNEIDAKNAHFTICEGNGVEYAINKQTKKMHYEKNFSNNIS